MKITKLQQIVINVLFSLIIAFQVANGEVTCPPDGLIKHCTCNDTLSVIHCGLDFEADDLFESEPDSLEEVFSKLKASGASKTFERFAYFCNPTNSSRQTHLTAELFGDFVFEKVRSF